MSNVLHDKWKPLVRLLSGVEPPPVLKKERPQEFSLRKEAELRYVLSITAVRTIVVFLLGAAVAELLGATGALATIWSVAGPIVGTLFGYYLAVQRANGNGH